MPTVVDLLFRQTPLPTTSPVDLLFGQTETLPDQVITISGALPALGGSVQVVSTERDVAITGALPGLGGSITAAKFKTVAVTGELPGLSGVISVAHPITVAITGALPGLGGTVEVNFNSDTERPTVGQSTHLHQIAQHVEIGAEDRVQNNLPQFNSSTGLHSTAIRVQSDTTDAVEPLDGLKVNVGASHTTADKLQPAQVMSPHQEMLRDRRPSVRTRSQDADKLRHMVTTSSQERYRDRRPSLRTAHQTAQALHTMIGSKHNVAIHVRKTFGVRHQEAMRPPAGIETPVVPPIGEPCYTPSPHLLFADLPGDANLLFICDNHVTPPDSTVVVPIRSVYIVMNNVTLRRVEGSVYLPTLSLSLSIDVDSWTWSFNASLPGQALDDVRSTDGQPVELEASINGNLYRLLAENVQRTRQFGDSRVSISGRGKNAILASPYAPVLTFANSIERTAQQLMADVLTFNEIPLGWDIDWQLEDWLVPAGVFNVQGSYIDGLNAIVGAAGAYLQPHPTDQEFRALLRYPVAPWNWAAEVTPDFELPTAVTTQEGIEWIKKPDYNRVYVSGQQQGVLGRVTREGTAGDFAAPMVTDQLITTAVAARQRGLSILADTGRQAMVSLRLPVLDETGIITPGAFVRYTDGSDIKLGIVRSTSVDASLPEVWQSIQVETHE
jgi:hypothetical protein